MKKAGLLTGLICLLSACSFTPKPSSIDERYTLAKQNIQQLFTHQNTFRGTLDFNQALARGLKYNLDYRIKLVNNALQIGQLDMAEFAMFPALNTSGSLYTRSNDLSSSGITTEGQTTSLSSSTPRTLRSSRIAVSWNVLDFGLAYVRAKQQGDRILIAEEESRKQLQRLTQDVLVAYWSAYSAQQLMIQAKEFQQLLSQAKAKLTLAIQDKSLPKETLLNYQATLLEGNRKLIQLKFKYDKALYDLKRLINLPLDTPLKIAPPPALLTKTQDIRNVSFQKIDAITLVHRPELQGQNYQHHIAKLGIKATILQALPGITLNLGWNYNSNKFLLNQKWVDKSMDVAWNLLNLASLPVSYHTATVQAKYEKLKLMALTMTVLTESRYAYSHYLHLSEECIIAHQQTTNANSLFELINNRRKASLASTQQLILSKLRAITAKMDEDLLLADLSNALGELYLSMGAEIIPTSARDQSLALSTKLIKQQLLFHKTMDFNLYVNHTYQKLFHSEANTHHATVVKKHPLIIQIKHHHPRPKKVAKTHKTHRLHHTAKHRKHHNAYATQ